MQQGEELIQLYDPGEVGRAEHNLADRIVVAISNVFAWLFPVLMVAICAQVILRGSGMNQAWLDDLQWWLYGAACLVGIGYAVTTNSHVRVDIFYDRFEDRKKAVYEVVGLVWLFLPFIILAWDVTLGYAISSVAADEGSDSPNGLHNLWILKVFMNAAFIFIAFAIWAAYVRNLRRLTGPTLFRQLLFAFPSTMFLVNLACYYAIFGYLFLTREPDMNARQVGRHAVFGEWEVGPWEIKYTILITLAATALVLLVAWLISRRRAEG